MTVAQRFRRGWLALMLALGGVAVATPATARALPVVRPAMECGALAETDIAPAGEAPARIVTAKIVATGRAGPYCEVRGYVAPHVRFELRLPTENWMQRLMFTGCGGFCGRLEVRVRAAEGCEPIDNGEFALVTSDLGHDAADGNGDTVWAANNRQGKVDYGHRAVHVVTVTAKAIVARFYGRAQRFAYFNGCSDGGREGMMEVQRYPRDFDGVTAGAAVIHDTINNTLFHGWAARHLRRADGARMFSTDDLAVLHKAALAACDMTGDGVRDGVVGDPAACRFDPAAAQCADGASGGCLTRDQVDAARALYAGPTDPRGKRLYFGRPVGSELAWGGPDVATYVRSFATYMANDTPQPFDLSAMTFDDAAVKRYGAMADIYDAVDPDIDAFRKAGGKLILWHGWADWGVPPMSTVAYYRQVRARFGVDTDAFLKLYMLPGVGHCQGGEGPDKLNLVDAMTAWVEDGVAPDAIVVAAKSYGRTTQTRPVYPYPATAVYAGSGDPMNAAAFRRSAPAR